MCGYFGKTDNLTYAYGDSNRLKKVTDASAPDKGFIYGSYGSNLRDYDYDKNGNLTADKNKGITNIQYNYLNLPQLITFTGSRTIGFVYDASGVKLQKITNDNGTIVTQNYINGIEYIGNTLERIPHAEGEIVNRGGSYVYEYALKDHLGNTRVTFTNNPGTNTLYATDIKQINHYYPFGLNMEGPGFGAQGANKYQYNSKELNSDFGLNWNDYGARFYDPAVARWNVVDPLAEAYQSMSPYHYAMNNPMRFIDPNGMYASDIGDDLFSGGGGDAQETKKRMAQQGSKYIAGGAGVKGNLDDIYVNSDGFEMFRIRNNDPDHYYAAERTDHSTWNVYADLGSDAPIPSSTEGALATIEGMPKLPDLESTLGYMRGHLSTGGLGTLDGFNDPIFNIITGASLFSGIAKVASAEKGVIVVGEGMARVEAAASRLQGATILNNMPKFTGTADQITSQMMTYNRQWILQQMRSGKPILDIGRDLNRANPSIFYQMEQNMMKNYLKLHPK